MKRHRFRLSLIAAACLASVWLWHRQLQLNAREAQLNSRITEARARLDIIRGNPAVPDTPHDEKKAPAGPETPEPAGKPLKVREFEDLVGEINQMETSLPSANLGDLIAETTKLLTTPAQRHAFLGKLATVPGLPPDTVGRFLGQVGREASPKEAAELLLQAGASLPADQFNRFAASAATARIDAGTPAQAEWLLKNLRGTDREPAISQLMQAWTQADFNAAGNWLRNQPPSADHDAAVASFASQVAGKEPPSAVDWAMTIADSAASCRRR
ncbi:MAG: hypothetical protein EOP86_21925 [Verrucomicrobiaceae bacterium]|nr:MAG: hypothetical protein EOP86_21925 [Verrucomicrobiaceae bacterium]